MKADIMHTILEQLENDHQRIIRLMYLLNREIERFSGVEPGKINFDTALEILDYIQVYPETWHHPVEDMLFERLLEKQTTSPSHAQTVLIMGEHKKLEALSEQLSLMFAEAQTHANYPQASILRLCKRYASAQISHINSERQLFNMINETFSPTDWLDIKQKIRNELRQNDSAEHRLYKARSNEISNNHLLTSLH